MIHVVVQIFAIAAIVTVAAVVYLMVVMEKEDRIDRRGGDRPADK